MPDEWTGLPPTGSETGSDSTLDHFDRAWEEGLRPAVDDYLPPPADPRRRALLAHLLHVDLERRLKAGEPARVESYLRRYPELAESPPVVVSLIVREHELRRRGEPGLGAEECLARFPAYRAELEGLLPGGPSCPAVAPPGSASALGQALLAAGLLAPPQAAELPALEATFPRPRDLAGELLRRGWVTAYQFDQLLVGRADELTLGPYVLLERVGQGGMGEVFKARHRLMKRVVALKVIRKDRLSDPEVVRRFRREIEAAAQLSHPNIVIAHDAGQAEHAYFLVMEYVEGTDLARVVQHGGPPQPALACEYARQAALGLQHAHERGLVHRDVKPANLLLTPAGQVKLLDLGLARLEASTTGGSVTALTVEGAVVGTPDFMAPEQGMESRDVDIRADVYSLGCTLYYLLSGRVPYPGGTAMEKLNRHQGEDPAPLASLCPGLPPGPAEVVARMMARRPEDRYQTPAEAAAALRPFCRTPPAATGPAAPAPCAGAPARRLWPLAAAVAAALVALALGLLTWLAWTPG